MGNAEILLHGFGQRYDLPISLALDLLAAGGVVVISFVMVVVFAGGPVLGSKALQYPRLALPFLVPVARSPWPRIFGGVIGVLALVAIVISGLLGSEEATRNPAEYLIWIYFWSASVIASGLVGNLWYLMNPWAAIYDTQL